MFRILFVLAVMLLTLPSAQAVEVEISFDTFDAPLAAHGEWVVVGSYGRVWRPHHVDSGWRPYFEGHWAWTDEGYLWVSDEPWAWATYHYGRWSYEPGWGWVWVPGYEWAPAWVEWRYSEGAVGWAPLFPTTVVGRSGRYEHWTFVPTRSFVGVHVAVVAYSKVQTREQWGHSQVAPTYHRAAVASGQPTVAVAFGPPRVYVERHVGRPLVAVTPISVSSAAEASRHRGAAVVFRPPTSVARPRTEPRPAATSTTPVEPAHVHPVRPAPERAEPARSAPARIEPARPAPERAEPARPTPARAEPARPSPTRVEPSLPAPARAEPTRTAQPRPQPQPTVRPRATEPATVSPPPLPSVKKDDEDPRRKKKKKK